MKLQADRIEGRNAISRHSVSGVIINGAQYTHSLVLPWDGDPAAWPVSSFETLDASHFEQLLAHRPQLVLFGSGARLRFPAPRLLAGLMQARIGFETMDTAAACRTYNVLASEHRRVLAALVLAPTP